MKKFLLLLVLYFITVPAQTTVINTSFFSAALNSERNVQVILPPNYSPDGPKYPVIYFLHGVLNNSTGYAEVNTVLNNLYGSGSINYFIVVKPDGSVGPYMGSFYTNSDLYGKFEDYIVTDLINFIQNTYNADTTRDKRFIAGHSMGAFGAFKIAFKHPDLFRAAAAHSGPLDFNNLNAQQPYILNENGGYAPYSYNPANGFFTNVFFTMAGAFSPNLTNPPYNVELPLDQDGNFFQPVLAKWMEHNPSGLVKNVDRALFPALYFDCGTFDELQLYVHNTGFRDTLNVMGMPYRYYSYTGYHSNKLPERLVYSLTFIDSVLRSQTASNSEEEFPEEFRLAQNFPNPFNPSTVISFFIPEEERVTLIVFDILGKQVNLLADENLQRGNHNLTFDAAGLPAGVYFCRFEAGKNSSVIKMLLLK